MLPLMTAMAKLLFGKTADFNASFIVLKQFRGASIPHLGFCHYPNPFFQDHLRCTSDDDSDG
jgi:hypothetical protein